MEKVGFETPEKEEVEVTKDDVENITLQDNGYVKVITEWGDGDEQYYLVSPARVWRVEG